MLVCLSVLIQLVQSDTQVFVLFDVFLACGNDTLVRISLSYLQKLGVVYKPCRQELGY
jgi:hypothetical protein